MLQRMTSYTVLYRGRATDEPFSDYRFDVLRDGRRVAELCHDHRGGDHRIRKPGNFWAALPRSVLQGGGADALQLSPDGLRTVEAFLAE